MSPRPHPVRVGAHTRVHLATRKFTYGHRAPTLLPSQLAASRTVEEVAREMQVVDVCVSTHQYPCALASIAADGGGAERWVYS